MLTDLLPSVSHQLFRVFERKYDRKREEYALEIRDKIETDNPVLEEQINCDAGDLEEILRDAYGTLALTTYELLDMAARRAGTKLPFVTSETLDAFKREYNRGPEMMMRIVLTVRDRAKFITYFAKSNYGVYDECDEALHAISVVYGLLEKQAEMNYATKSKVA